MLFYATQVGALETILSPMQAPHNIVVYINEESSPLLKIIEDNLELTAQVVLNSEDELAGSWRDYRLKSYDYLLCINTDKNTKKISVELRSIWLSQGTPQHPIGPALIAKSFECHASEEIRYIAHQISDEIVEMILGTAGFASYPIAYIASSDRQHQICLSDWTHSHDEVIYQTTSPISGLSWAPHGSSIAFVEMGPHNSSLKIIDLCSKKVTIVCDNSYIASPVFSSDNCLYFIALSNRIPQIFEYNIIKSESKMITQDNFWIADLQQGPDRDHLLLSSDRSGIYQIYMFNIHSQKYTRLSFHPYPCISGLLNHKRKSIFFCEIADRKSFMIERSFEDLCSRYVTFVGETEEMSFAPYQDLIVYEHTLQGYNNIVVKSLKTSQECIWVAAEGWLYSKPCWSPRPRIHCP
jgi:Tol biopolymer transport system component